VTAPTDPIALFHGLSGADRAAAALPKRRRSHEAKGKLLHFPRTGLVMVPFEYHSNGDWSCVVVVGTDTYPPNGYSLWVSGAEIETAVEWQAVAPAETSTAPQAVAA
jgi:hypothetical protein